jgi:hypothetical protein
MKTASEKCKRWRERHPEYFKTEAFKLARLNGALKYKYGITLEEKREFYEKQKGLCTVCLLPLPHVLSDGCCVDHDHTTERVRGLTHKACNVWVGFIEKHGREVLDRIKSYL